MPLICLDWKIGSVVFEGLPSYTSFNISGLENFPKFSSRLATFLLCKARTANFKQKNSTPAIVFEQMFHFRKMTFSGFLFM